MRCDDEYKGRYSEGYSEEDSESERSYGDDEEESFKEEGYTRVGQSAPKGGVIGRLFRCPRCIFGVYFSQKFTSACVSARGFRLDFADIVLVRSHLHTA